MKTRFIYSGQDMLDFINEAISNARKIIRKQTVINNLMLVSTFGLLAAGYLQYQEINKLQKNIEELKHPEGE